MFKQAFSKIARRGYHPNNLEHASSKVLPPLIYSKDSPQWKILANALDEQVPKYGFNERALTSSCSDLGYSSSFLSVLGASNSPSFFNSSPAVLELLKFHLVSKRYSLTDGVADGTLESPSLENLFLKRLEMNKPIAAHLSQLLSCLALPGAFLAEYAIPELHRLSDDMVYFSNEPDHNDFAWYSKRLAISTAYVSSELFMAQDKSIDYQDTVKFAKEKLKNIKQLGEAYNNVEEYAWYTLLSSISLAKSQMTRS